MGTSLDQFFDKDNTQPLTEYLNIIRQSLIAIGVPEERIIDVPALIFLDNFKETVTKWEDFSKQSQGRESSRKAPVMSQRKVPMYTPVNGIQLAKAGENKTVYISGAGVKPFDEYTKNILKQIGVEHVSIPSLVGLGYASAGFRCAVVPW